MSAAPTETNSASFEISLSPYWNITVTRSSAAPHGLLVVVLRWIQWPSSVPRSVALPLLQSPQNFGDPRRLVYMGGGWFPKLVWPKHNMINQQVKVGVANNDKRAKCWCGTGKVGVAAAIPAIQHSPPMLVYVPNPHMWLKSITPTVACFCVNLKWKMACPPKFTQIT